jgi:peptidyl-prolyl cis-trans isomerase D
MKNRRNTDAVEVAPNTLVAARVVESAGRVAQAFEAVKGEIEKQLKSPRKRRPELAKEDGEAMLARLRQGGGVPFPGVRSRPSCVSRCAACPRKRSAPSSRRQPTSCRPMPACNCRTMAVYMIYQDRQGAKPLERATTIRSAACCRRVIRATRAQEDFNAYLAALRQRYKRRRSTSRRLLENGELSGAINPQACC